jgi:dolichyl-phosphate-mannose--protein O-mannosyl transferase
VNDPRLLFFLSFVVAFVFLLCLWPAWNLLKDVKKSHIAIVLATLALFLEILRIGFQVRGYL